MMTWGRGFFRAWLVLSAIWIGLFMYFYEPKTYASAWRAHLVDFDTPSGRQVTFDTSNSHQELTADVTKELLREAKLPSDFVALSPEEIHKLPDDKLLEYVKQEREDAKHAPFDHGRLRHVDLEVPVTVSRLANGGRVAKFYLRAEIVEADHASHGLPSRDVLRAKSSTAALGTFR